MALSIRVLCEI